MALPDLAAVVFWAFMLGLVLGGRLGMRRGAALAQLRRERILRRRPRILHRSPSPVAPMMARDDAHAVEQLAVLSRTRSR